ncbi:MAG: biotin--[acetyl-CoA-carboxylase] ligase [Thermoleophilia bacterium]|nr:biotin--[acetyl-CoA-carboxylase] ligase [Thermoleophilia bacterium]
MPDSVPTPPLGRTQTEVLWMLAEAKGGHVSGQDLSAALGVTRAAVAKAVGSLREAGYGIESAPRRGHRLVSRPDRLTQAEVVHGLASKDLGRSVHHFERCGTTQAVARQLAEEGAPHGTLVVAEVQTAARGRLGREYCSPAGGIWCTLIRRGPMPTVRAPLVPLAAGVAVADAVSAVAGVTAAVKWPNDVMVGGRKVAGILTELAAEEQRVRYILVGTGVNVNVDPAEFPPEVAATAGSLGAIAGRRVGRAALLQRYLERLEVLYGDLCAGRLEAVLDAWRAMPNSIGKAIRTTTSEGVAEGFATGIDGDGALLVRRDDGAMVRLLAGDVVEYPDGRP